MRLKHIFKDHELQRSDLSFLQDLKRPRRWLWCLWALAMTGLTGSWVFLVFLPMAVALAWYRTRRWASTDGFLVFVAAVLLSMVVVEVGQRAIESGAPLRAPGGECYVVEPAGRGDIPRCWPFGR